MTDILRVMWKEYRVLRSLWLALALFGLAGDALIFMLVAEPQERLPGIFGFAGVLPVGFALGACAMLFALEREEATREFLRFVPVTSSRIFMAKVLMAVLGTVLLGLLLSAVSLQDVRALMVRPSRPWSSDLFLGARDMTLIYLLLVAQAMGWSVFFSLRSARTLLAALLGALGAVSSIGLVHAVAEPDGVFGNHRLWLAPALHAAATVAIWSIDVWLGRRWLHDRHVAWRAASDETGLLTVHKRLLWQQWRGSRRVLAAVIVLGLAVPLLLWPAFIPMSVLGFALLGACTFLSDQEAGQFRFFAERGVSPGHVWLSRQLFCLIWAVGLACMLLAAHGLAAVLLRGLLPDETEARKLWDELGWIFEAGGLAVWIGLSFGAGQLCSMFFRSGVLAAALGVVLAGVLACWAVLMHTFQIALWWSAAPLIVAMFAATWLRAGAWMLERNHVRAWLPTVAMLAVPFLGVLASVPAYRIWEIPEPLATFEPSPPPASSPEARLAARQLFWLCESMAFPKSSSINALYHPADDQPSADELQWLKQNNDALDDLVAAIERLRLDSPTMGAAPQSVVNWESLAALILRSGQVAENDRKLDEAWRRYRAVLRLAQFCRRGSTAVGEVFGAHLEEATAMQLARWGAREGQTAERLSAGIGELRRSEATDGSLADVMAREYAAYLAIIDDLQKHPEQWSQKAVIAARWAPWEFTRTRRLLAYMASLNAFEARYADLALQSGSPQFPSATLISDEVHARDLWRTTLYEPLLETRFVADVRRSTVCYRRAAQLALAAEAWRLAHDALPEKFDSLQGVYFDDVPVDPYNGRPFTWLPWGLRAAVQSQNAGAIPAGTSLVYSEGINVQAGEEGRRMLERLRRKSADDPILEAEPPSLGGGPAAGLGMPVAAGVTAPAPGPPTAGVAEPAEFLEGLTFPVGRALPTSD